MAGCSEFDDDGLKINETKPVNTENVVAKPERVWARKPIESPSSFGERKLILAEILNS